MAKSGVPVTAPPKTLHPLKPSPPRNHPLPLQQSLPLQSQHPWSNPNPFPLNRKDHAANPSAGNPLKNPNPSPNQPLNPKTSSRARGNNTPSPDATKASTTDTTKAHNTAPATARNHPSAPPKTKHPHLHQLISATSRQPP